MAAHSDLDLLGTRQDERARDYVELLGKFPYRPTLFLGLGGTGAQCVQKMKSLFLEYVKPQAERNQKAAVRDIDPMYAFLAFDSNRGEHPQGLAENREWFHLGVKDLKRFYEAAGKADFYADWLVKGYPAGSVMAGAGGFRNIGRLALILNIATVSRAIEQAKEQILGAAASAKVSNTQPRVVVFGSLSGGTGSGMLLDTCFLLRRAFDTASMVGIIGVLDGLPSLPQEKRSDLRVNTFCGLKELHAFMTGTAEGFVPGSTLEYPSGAFGTVTEPFDECHLVSSYRADGAHNLPTQPHLTSFMTRFAFMMSAYSFSGKELGTPDYAGVMVNHASSLAKKQSGTRTCYVVPGLAQVHFPVATVANLFVLEAAKSYLRHQSSGAAPAGEEEARAFIEKCRLDFRSLQVKVGANPKDARGGALAAMAYDDEVQELMAKKSSVRHANRHQILALGKKMPQGRLRELLQLLQPNVDDVVGSVWAAAYAEFCRRLVEDGVQGLGALDFLDDLRLLLEQERARLDAHDRDVTAPAMLSIERDWKAIEALVDDVATSSGVVDKIADYANLGHVRTAYVAFLNQAEQTVLEKARQDGAKAVFAALVERIESLAAKQRALVHHDIPAAVQVLESRTKDLHTRLYQQTEGQDDSVENICSVNVITQEWRDNYLEKEGLTPPQVLSTLLKQGWHPRDLLEITPAKDTTAGAAVAQHVVDRIDSFFSAIRAWTPVDFLKKTAELGRQKPEDLIARIYSKSLQPQLEITGMNTLLSLSPQSVVFCGGIDEALKERLKATDAFTGVALNVADNQETHRINFFSATLPVSPAGADLIERTLQAEFTRWSKGLEKLNRKEQEYQRSLFHCFPGSVRWPLPTRFSHGFERAKELFARAFAVCEMLPLDDSDRKRMLDLAATPKEQGYGLFQFSRTQFWIWPFFAPQTAGSVISGKPVKLGSNVVEAYETLARHDQAQADASAWANWFEENWSRFYVSAQLEERRRAAIASFQAKKGKTNDQAWIELWDEVIQIVDGWQIG